jgi:hypothetical protein
MRFFLGTGKYTPFVAVQGDMGLKPIIIDQWKSVCNHWHRCLLYLRRTVLIGKLIKAIIAVKIGHSL